MPCPRLQTSVNLQGLIYKLSLNKQLGQKKKKKKRIEEKLYGECHKRANIDE